jgi:hypothetical protein
VFLQKQTDAFISDFAADTPEEHCMSLQTDTGITWDLEVYCALSSLPFLSCTPCTLAIPFLFFASS